jgi:hypothetical protein
MRQRSRELRDQADSAECRYTLETMSAPRRVRLGWLAAALMAGAQAGRAQQAPAGPDATAPAVTVTESPRPKFDGINKESIPEHHRFWDRRNDVLFLGVAASRTLDYFSTLNMRRRGRQEILLSNDAVDNHAAFALIETAGTGVAVGVSYLFHRYGHHKLERWTSAVHISLATTGAIRNYCLKTAHQATAP